MRIFKLAPARRIFLILWGGWTVVALVCAALYLLFHEVGLVLASIILVVGMVAMAGIEYNFRRRSLPHEARRPWHAILVFPVLLVPTLMMTVGHNYAHYLPGSQAWLVALVFSAALFPVTLLVVGVTMFPRALHHPVAEDPIPV